MNSKSFPSLTNSNISIISTKNIFKYFLLFFMLNLINLTLTTQQTEKDSSLKNQDPDREEEDNLEIKLPTHLDEEEYKLIQINFDNFNETLSKVEHFFLLIHNPWCKFSQKMDEKLLSVHKILKLEIQPYYIGALDSSLIDADKFIEKFIQNEDLYVPKTYPKLIYFYKGIPQEIYNDKHNRDSLLTYIKRKIYKESIKLPIQAIFDYKVVHDKDAFVLVNGNALNETLSHAEKLANKEAFELFNKISEKHKNVVFYHTFDKKITDYLFSKNGSYKNETIYTRGLNILYFSKGKLLDVYLNEKLKVIFERSLTYFISKHVNSNYFTKFSEEAINQVFIKKQPAFIFFRNKFDNKTDYLEQNLPLLASQESGLKFIITDIAGKFELKLAKLMLISNKNLPSIRIIDFNGGFRRYEYEGDFENENVMNFIKNWKKGQYKPYYSTQNINQNEGNKKKEIVRKIGNANFYESVIMAKRNVLVFFYTNWCAHCKKV